MHSNVLHEILYDLNPWWLDPTRRRATAYPVRRELFPRLLDYVGGDRRAVLLAGPRQVGKTILLLQIADELLEQGWPPSNVSYFDFSDERLPENFSPREVIEAIPVGVSADHPRVFIFDEISNASKWASWLKHAVDTRQNRFVITDSAASLLHEGSRESGQGRWDELRIEGISFVEFLQMAGMPGDEVEKTFRRIPNAVDRFLSVGGFPEHAQSDDYNQVRGRLRSDIADRAIRRDLGRFGVEVERVRALFLYLVQDSGAIFNASVRARDLNADQRSVRQWAALLEDAHLTSRLPRHTKSASSRLRSQPKIYASDHGLIGAFTPRGSAEREQDIRARAVEALVFRHLRELAESAQGELSFFRQDEDLEADFVLELDDGCVIIEATGSPSPPTRKFERLRRVGKILKSSHLVMIHGGVVESSNPPIISISLARFLLDPSSVRKTKT